MIIRAVAVDYHNTLPLRAGIERLVDERLMTLDLAHPAEATRRFSQGQYQLGLLPVAAKLSNPSSEFVGDYGIVSDGFVGSVGIFSEVPLHEIETLFLDHDSRSSVLLARVLLRHHWGLAPRLVKASRGYRKQISGTTAGVIIGDPAIAARSQFRYYYDLGEAWKSFTGLPFVYAAWLSTFDLPADFISQFDAAQAEGVAMRERLAVEFQPLVPNYNLKRYFTRQIHYRLDEQARAGRLLFMELGAEELDVASAANTTGLTLA